MDLKKALSLLVREFDSREIPYALIGGFAMGALGAPRSTIDLDFLIASESLGKVEAVMLESGYKKVFSSENASQYVSPDKELGEVDFLHAFRPISRKMLENSGTAAVFAGAIKVKVLKAEDLIGLKVQAIANNPNRFYKDNADIEELLKIVEVDWEKLKTYFALFDMTGRFLELRAKYERK
ncbi:MAG: nucleotidyltransferase family protein [Elusimicrobia bacterium]|nr:nucleotidyltransferase family protein [Elusimicrobiota bacterium]